MAEPAIIATDLVGGWQRAGTASAVRDVAAVRIGLPAAGQSSTFTGTIAGQVRMAGLLDLRIPC